jgi:radical SAM superfamily enzyme YgiQ (UPF0313 family)
VKEIGHVRLTLVGTGITLPSVGESARRYNLATASLHASLATRRELQGRLEVTRIDLPISLDHPRFDPEALDRVLATRPDLLGLSCYAWDLAAQLDLAHRVRLERPEMHVVIGGPSASVRAEDILAEHPAVEVVVRGEGEVTLAEALANGLDDLSGVSGLSWRDPKGRIRHEIDRPPLADLGELPSPILDGLLVPPRQNLLLEYARGCRSRCAYCAWKLYGGGLRHRPASRARQELAWARERGYEHAFIIDSSINDDDQRLAWLAQAAREADPGGRLAFSYFIDAERISPSQLPHLSILRPHEVTVGLETVNPVALRACGRRPPDLDRFARALDLLSEVTPATVSLMLGMPGDDLEHFTQTLDFVARLAERQGKPRVHSVRVHWMMIAPGSVLWRRAAAQGLELASEGIPYVLSSPTFPRGDLIEALRTLRDHPRADLFVWEDAEPWRALQQTNEPQMYAAGGDHLGGRTGRSISDDQVWRALRPLRPGRELSGGFVVGALTRSQGFPVVRLEGPRGGSVELQLRPLGAEPNPLARTRSFDLIWLAQPVSSRHDEGEHERKLLRLMVELVRRNDRAC